MDSIQKPYLRHVQWWEHLFEQHGDSPQALGSRDVAMEEAGFQAVLGILEHERRPVSLLDFGCGPSHLYEYLQRTATANITYAGLDLSDAFVDLSRRKYPENTYYCLDVLDDSTRLPEFDYIVINGIFTSRPGMSHDEMMTFLTRLLPVLFAKVRCGLAFNATSKHVDWERDDLFHLPFDELARFLRSTLSERFTFRHDYGYHEYTTYVYR